VQKVRCAGNKADESWLGMVENPQVEEVLLFIYQENSKSVFLENNIFET